jgi:acyl-CoA synthetase (AMP-forming)/AMP-acid ligase II
MAHLILKRKHQALCPDTSNASTKSHPLQPLNPPTPNPKPQTLNQVEIKLIDATTEDNTGPLCDSDGRPYKVTDRVNVKGEPCKGRGEVLIGGPVVTDGYYKMPDKTREAYIDGGGSSLSPKHSTLGEKMLCDT